MSESSVFRRVAERDLVMASIVADLQRAADKSEGITLADYQVRLLLRYVGQLEALRRA